MSQLRTIVFDLETLPKPREIYERIPSLGNWPGRTFKTQLHTIMSFGFKELGSSKVFCVNGWDLNKNWREDDAPLVDFIYSVLSDADQLISHNGIKFDLRAINTKRAEHLQPPVPKIHHIDTCVVARHKLSLYSNSLDEVARYLGCAEKMKWNDKWSTWTRFAFEEDTAKDRRIMDKYCKQDVSTLEEVYMKLRPLIGNKSVNHNVIKNSDKPVCPQCGSVRLHRNGRRIAGGHVYQRMQCFDCGTWSKLYKTKQDQAGHL